MDMWTQQVLDAMMRQNGGIPQGPPTNVPNFTRIGGVPGFNPYQLSGQGIVPPVSGNLPVPYQQPGLPAVNPAEALSAPPIPPQAAAGAGPVAEAAITPPGMMARAGGLMRAAAPVFRAGALPVSLASLALANDPGHLDETNNGQGRDMLAESLNPTPADTGLVGTGKGMLRGAARAGMGINDFVGSAKDFVTQSKAEREMKREMQAERQAQNTEGGAVPGVGNLSQPSIEDALGLAAHHPTAGGAREIAGGNAPGQGVLDALLQNFISGKPGKAAKADPGDELNSELTGMGSAILSNPQIMRSLNPKSALLLALGTGANLGGQEYRGKVAASALKNQKDTAEWAKDAADIGIRTEGEKRQEREENRVKIHATKNGILIEQPHVGEDGKTYTTLQPLDNSIFGGDSAASALNPKAKVNVMGKSFTNLDKDPLGKEKMLLSQLESSGDLMDIMAAPNMKKAMEQADKLAMEAGGGANSSGAAQDKMKWDARRAVILKNMVENPDFKQNLVDRIVTQDIRWATSILSKQSLALLLTYLEILHI